jgi:hypothetical protein
MASAVNVYNVIEERSSTELRFIFFSTGKKIVTKVIIYTYTHQFEDREVYNLGFGDYNQALDDIQDKVKTNNGDAYKVFSTVLSTIPMFFEIFPNAILMVQGSDSGPDFAKECMKTCNRRCHLSCHNSDQRVSIYRNFVEKHFIDLGRDYWFLGGFTSTGYKMIPERYIPSRKYDAILMFRK